jgi:hypothetical protein
MLARGGVAGGPGLAELPGLLRSHVGERPGSWDRDPC